MPSIGDFAELQAECEEFQVVMALCDVIDTQKFRSAPLHEEFAHRLERCAMRHRQLAKEIKS